MVINIYDMNFFRQTVKREKQGLENKLPRFKQIE